jgi:triacylglycerol lipase
MSRLKPLPAPSIDLLVLPQSDTEYVHFEDAERHPFDREASGFSRVNAWWLAEAALLSYWDEDAAQPIWRRAGLQLDVLSQEGLQCHIGSADGLVIVAFRGTQPNWDNLRGNLEVAHRDWDLGGAVHEGFLHEHQQFWPVLEDTLRRLDPTGRSTWFTGHSLGAALATLSMDRWPARGLYTIGSPPVGNRRFARGFDSRHAGRCFRYVNHLDIVVYVASWLSILIGNYTHVKARKYIDAQGVISGGAPSIADWLVLRGAFKAVNSLRRPSGGLDAVPVVDWLIDHTPRRSAVRIWNDYASMSPAAAFSSV